MQRVAQVCDLPFWHNASACAPVLLTSPLAALGPRGHECRHNAQATISSSSVATEQAVITACCLMRLGSAAGRQAVVYRVLRKGEVSRILATCKLSAVCESLGPCRDVSILHEHPGPIRWHLRPLTSCGSCEALSCVVFRAVQS
jgi:hypothetical protein